MRGRAHGRGHVPPFLPCLLHRPSQKGSAVSAVPAGTACAAGRPADSASQRAAGSKVQSFQLAWLGSGGHSQEHGLLSVFSQSTAPCSQQDRCPDTARPYPAQERGCVPPEGPGGHCHTPCGSPPVQPPLRDLTQGSLSLHFLEVLAVLGFPSIFLYISVSTFFWSACFFTSLESSAWMVWGGRTGWRYQPCTTSACHPQQVPPPLGCARNVVEELRNSSRGDPASSCPMSQCHGAVPGWHGTPCESNAPLSFLAVQATPCLAQGAEPDIRKGILSFNRDRKVSALRTDMCQLSHFLSGSCWESSLKTQPGVKWDCSKTHSVPTPALLGQEKALSPVWSPQAPQKQQEEPGS